MAEIFDGKIRVLIVDDSPFSRQLIADSLDPLQFEVVGFADGFQTALEHYRTLMPDVVTMDIVMPEMDGLEVTQRIIAEEPDAKIVIISSMKDEELVAAAQAKGVTSFLQKPFSPAELMRILKDACSTKKAGDSFKNYYPDIFIDSCITFIKRFAAEIQVEPVTVTASQRQSASGLVALVGITGKFSGRMFCDLSVATAQGFAARLLKQDPESLAQVHDVIAEFANIVAGHAASRLNKEFRGANLRISPPAIFAGDDFSIASPKADLHIWKITTPYGQVRLSVGFEKGAI